jgi:hypothetical protein
MKKLAIGLFILGLTSQGFSQNTKSEVEVVNLKDVVLSTANMNYLAKVLNNTMSDQVKLLEENAAKFDITVLPEYDGHKEAFKTIFRGNEGYIIATYDHNGNILKTSERYKDIALPKNIIKSILREYPKSDFLKVVYTVDYNHQKDVKKTYKIQIIKDNLVKNLKISSDGNIDKTVTMSIVN